MKKRTTALVLCFVLAAVAIIGGSLAYFTYTSDTKTNAFQFQGSKNDDNEGVIVDEEFPGDEDTGEHRLIPGAKFQKNPRIRNVSDTDLWAFFTLEIENYWKLINLMGQEAYANDVAFPTLTGDYPGPVAFVAALNASLADDKQLFQDVVDHWFEGITHKYWKVMNKTEVTARITAAVTAINSSASTSPTPDSLTLILGYQGEMYYKYTDPADTTSPIIEAGTCPKPGIIPKAVQKKAEAGDIIYDKDGNSATAAAGDLVYDEDGNPVWAIEFLTPCFMTGFKFSEFIDNEMLYENEDATYLGAAEFFNYGTNEELVLAFTARAIQAPDEGIPGTKDVLPTLDDAYQALFPTTP